jgi:hypothetical protein
MAECPQEFTEKTSRLPDTAVSDMRESSEHSAAQVISAR